jgi:hypothetical protein
MLAAYVLKLVQWYLSVRIEGTPFLLDTGSTPMAGPTTCIRIFWWSCVYLDVAQVAYREAESHM